MKDITATSFGYIIAFILPGMVFLYALTFLSSNIHELAAPALAGNVSVATGFLALMVALIMGLIISAMRFVVFEKFLCKKHELAPTLFESLAKNEKHFGFFKEVVEQHYRYHQFYGGLSLSLVPLYGGWLIQAWKNFHLFALNLSLLGFL